MFELIKSIYARRVAENQVATRLIQEASNLVTERPDGDGWTRAFAASDQEKGFVETNQLEMIRKAREHFRFDPNAKGALTTLVNYIMGKGLTITPKSKDPMVLYVWREFWTSPRNRMALKQFEIVLRPLRDGELFIEFFDEDDDGASVGKTTIRFVDPLLVRADAKASLTPDPNAQKTINAGIETNPEDIEDVISYNVQRRDDPQKFRKVLAEKMHHIKLNVDCDQKRGETMLLSIMQMLKHYAQWIDNRIILNKMRSAIVLIKNVQGSPAEVAQVAATLPTVRSPSSSSQKQNFRSGTIITAGPGVKYEMMSANLNAQDAKEDGRNIKTNMAAGLNLPEYVFGDASNQNYASSLIAESPFVKAVQYWQILYEYHFGQIFRKVVENAVAAGILTEPDDDAFIAELKALGPDLPKPLAEALPGGAGDEVPTPPTSAGAETSPTAKLLKQPPEPDPRQQKLNELMPDGRLETPCEIFYGCDMTWPEIVHRDMKQHVDALSIARQNGWIADSTACAGLGYDYPEEVRKQKQIEEEAAQTGNPLIGSPGGDASATDASTMDAELSDLLNNLSPEERDGVLKAKDPREVVRIISKRKAAVPAAGEP